jgi:hypothetical protein
MGMDEKAKDRDEKRYWLDDPRNVKKVVWVLVVVCSGLFFADAFYEKHGLFSVEHLFGFYALFGFIVCVGLVLVAKWMRTFLMRPEDYYEPDD